MSTNRYCIEYSKTGTAGCKKCKEKIEKKALRIGKIVPNPFGDDGGEMKQWFHMSCIFEQLEKARATTKKIEDPGDLEGWENIEDDDRKLVMKHIRELEEKSTNKSSNKTPKSKSTSSSNSSSKSTDTPKKEFKPKKSTSDDNPALTSNTPSIKKKTTITKSGGKDDLFREFRKILVNVAEVSSYLEKTKIFKEFFEGGADGKGFKGDLHLWVKMLLPGVTKRIYNLQSKQLIKIFSQMFGADQDAMLEDLEKGDIAETVRIFFEQSTECVPIKKSTLTIQDIDNMLEKLSQKTHQNDQMKVLEKIAEKCTGNDLKVVVRLIKHDLRINAGPKHVLEALHPKAYEAFQASRNLDEVINRVLEMKESGSDQKDFGAKASLMTPVLPMLAEACKSVDYAFSKCPNGMFAEIKYDGERVQVHKQGDEFKYFSRSLKPVLPHKVEHLKNFIPKAFEFGEDLILDAEVLLIDTKNGKPLPFGTLGKHKKEAFKEASVCLFVFDCLHYNGENLMEKPLTQRKNTLMKVMKEIPNHVVFSELKGIDDKKELKDLIEDVISQGLEGLVLKDKKSKYSPGKRHWLKVKKDYLEQGAMADTADLVVLGAYFGTGQKGGMMSIFLMGCWDEDREKWCTVTKVHGGHDDETLARLQDELDMVKISKDFSKVPSWLDIKKPLVPDFICKNPKKAHVWEITGAEFSQAEAHTAGGISIRFPRVTKIRSDKMPKDATTLKELKVLFKNSKQTTQFTGMKPSPTKKKSHLDDDEIDTEISSSKEKSKKLAKNSPSHGSKEGIENSCFGMFHDVFTNVNMYIPKSTKDYDVLVRYFVAFDGTLLLKHEVETSATHVLVDDGFPAKRKKPENAHSVPVDWLWDSIKLKKMQDEKLYLA